MSLPWVPFNFAKYFTDTLHLDNEGHGAYILLIGHYYLKEQPIKDDDRSLASLTKLPLDRWLELRPIMEDFFEIKDGLWHHTHCDDVLRDAYVTYNAKKERTAAATAARYVTKPVTDTPRSTSRTTSRSKTPSRPRHVVRDDQRNVNVTVPVTDTQEHLHLNNSLSVSETIGEKANSGDNSEAVSGTFISETYRLTDEALAAARAEPDVTDEVILKELTRFIGHHLEKGTMSKNWDGSWMGWWANRKPAPKKAPPRIVTTKQPEIADWEAACERYARNQSHWPRHMGPEPGMATCKCPHEVLKRYGIDPATGVVRKVTV